MTTSTSTPAYSAEDGSALIALTVDVEGALDRVEAETIDLLELFSHAGVRATFFVLGEVAEAHPGLVRAIVSRSHEIGFHGFHHVFLSQLGPARFASELRDWLPRLEEIAQRPVRGFRAPCFSLAPHTAWALSILANSSIEYDASLYAGVHHRYGWRGAPTQPARLAGTKLQLFPVPLLHNAIPIGFSGGRWLRALPLSVVLWGFAQQGATGRVGMVYLHPWEIAQERRSVKRILDRFKGRLLPMVEVLSSLPELPEWHPTLPPTTPTRKTSLRVAS